MKGLGKMLISSKYSVDLVDGLVKQVIERVKSRKWWLEVELVDREKFSSQKDLEDYWLALVRIVNYCLWEIESTVKVVNYLVFEDKVIMGIIKV